MTTISADMDRVSASGRTVTRGQVAKAVLALARGRGEVILLADILGYDDERTYRTVGGINTVNARGGRG